MADAAAAPEPEPFLVLEGELKKSSGGKHTVGKVKSTLNTKRRYFVLTEDGRLRYFKSQKEFQANKAECGSVDVRALTKDGKRATRVAIEPGEMSFTVLTPNRDLTCSAMEDDTAQATKTVDRWAGAISAVARGDGIGARMSVSTSSADTEALWDDRLRAWMTTEEAKAGAKFNFPAMSATQRKGMHSVCKGLGLHSDSSGNSRRHVWATLERPKERGKHIPNVLQINTSNNGKFTEFHRVLAELIPSCTLKRTETDVHEILSSVENVSAHKATVCGVGVLVEDTSLDVEAAEGGAEGTAPAVDVGVNVRWFMKKLLANSSEFVGRRASWRVILSMMLENSDGSTIVRLYEGVVKGTLVEPRGEGGFGFDPVFLPDGAEKTLAEEKPDAFNARTIALQCFAKGEHFKSIAPIHDWTGEWQEEEEEGAAQRAPAVSPR